MLNRFYRAIIEHGAIDIDIDNTLGDYTSFLADVANELGMKVNRYAPVTDYGFECDGWFPDRNDWEIANEIAMSRVNNMPLLDPLTPNYLRELDRFGIHVRLNTARGPVGNISRHKMQALTEEWAARYLGEKFASRVILSPEGKTHANPLVDDNLSTVTMRHGLGLQSAVFHQTYNTGYNRTGRISSIREVVDGVRDMLSVSVV